MRAEQMQARQTTGWILALGVLLSGCSHAAELGSGEFEKIETILNDGRVVVVLVDLLEPDEVAQDDAYDDFAYYLNDFASHAPENLFELVRLSATDLERVEGLPARLEPWSVVFLHATKSSFYSGPIYEPQVYVCIQSKYTGEPTPQWAQNACPQRFDFSGF